MSLIDAKHTESLKKITVGKNIFTGVGGVRGVDGKGLLWNEGTEISRRQQNPHKGVHLLLLAQPAKYCLSLPFGLVLNRFCAPHPQGKVLFLILLSLGCNTCSLYFTIEKIFFFWFINIVHSEHYLLILGWFYRCTETSVHSERRELSSF